MGLDLVVRPWQDNWYDLQEKPDRPEAERRLRVVNGALARQGVEPWTPAEGGPSWRAGVGNYHLLHVLREFAREHGGSENAHIQDHADNEGFYIPVRFEHPLWIPMPPQLIGGHVWKPSMSVGSSLVLLDELNALGTALNALRPDPDEIRWGLRLGPHGERLDQDEAEKALGERETTILRVARALHRAVRHNIEYGTVTCFR